MIRVFLLAVLFMMVGCASEHLTYYADPDVFTDGQLAAMEAGCESWNHHAIRQCYITTDSSEGNASVQLRAPEHMAGPPGSTGAADTRHHLIYIIRGLSDDSVQMNFAHEHGHMIMPGGEHLPQEEHALMSPSAESKTPTEADIAFCRRKGACK